LTFDTPFYAASTLFDRAMRLALDVLAGKAEWESWKCGCERVHLVGTCVAWIWTCGKPDCQRIAPPEPLVLTGEE
jgi:hypothetical protein